MMTTLDKIDIPHSPSGLGNMNGDQLSVCTVFHEEFIAEKEQIKTPNIYWMSQKPNFLKGALQKIK